MPSNLPLARYRINGPPPRTPSEKKRTGYRQFWPGINRTGSAGTARKVKLFEGRGVKHGLKFDMTAAGLPAAILKGQSPLRPAIQQAVDSARQHLAREIHLNLTGRVVKKRTGTLLGSVDLRRRYISQQRGKIYVTLEALGTGHRSTLYARVLEKGGIIRPRFEEWLTFKIDEDDESSWVKTKQTVIPAFGPFQKAVDSTKEYLLDEIKTIAPWYFQ